MSVLILAITIETGFRGEVTSPFVKIAETTGVVYIAGAAREEGLCDGEFGGEERDKHEDGEDESENEEDVVIHEGISLIYIKEEKKMCREGEEAREYR